MSTRHFIYSLEDCVGRTVSKVLYFKGVMAIHFSDQGDPLVLFPMADEAYGALIKYRIVLHPTDDEDLIDALDLWAPNEATK